MLNRAAVHSASLVNLMVGDHGSSQVPVQQKNNGAVQLRMIPQFQISGGFGISYVDLMKISEEEAAIQTDDQDVQKAASAALRAYRSKKRGL